MSFASALKQSSAFPPYQIPATTVRSEMTCPIGSIPSNFPLAPARPTYSLQPICFSASNHALCPVPNHHASVLGYGSYASYLGMHR